MTLAKLMVILGLDAKLFHVGLTQAAAQLRAFQASTIAMTRGMALSSVGRGLTYGLTLPILAAATAAGIFGTQLTSEMARVQSVIATPGNTRDGLIARWTDDVQRLGVTLGRTSPEVAGGLYEIVSAFGDIGNATKFLEIAGRGAVAGQSDIVTSTKNLVLSTRAWGDSSTVAVQRMSDLMSATVRVGTLTESELGPAMAGLLPIARLYNVRLEDSFAALASLAGVSGTASQASTQLQRAITSLVAPNTTLTKLYKANGIASGETLIAQRGLIGAFQEIVRISEATGIPLQKMLGRIEGLKAISTLTGPQLEAFNDNLTAMGNAAGDVDRAFAGATSGIGKVEFQWGQAFQRMRVMFEDLYIAFGPAALNVANALAPIGEGLATMAQGVGKMDTDKLTIIVSALLGLALLGPVLSIIGGLVSLFGALQAAAALLWGPVGLVALAFAALWLAYNQNWLGVKDKIAGAWQWILDNAPNVTRELDQLSAAISEIANPPLPEGPGDQVPGLFERFARVQKEAVDVLREVWISIGQQTAGFRASFIAGWNSMWDSAMDSLSRWSEAIRVGVGVALGAVVLQVALFATTIKNGLQQAWAGAVQGVSQFVSGLKTGFGNVISAAKNAVSNVKSAFTSVGWSSIGSSIISGIVSGIKNAAGGLASAAATAAKSALSAAKGALGIKSPSTVFRDQVGAMIPAGMALGIRGGANQVNQALSHMLSLAGGGDGRMALQLGYGMADFGGGGTTHHSETNFGDIIVNVMAGDAATGKEIGVSITGALQRRGLL